MPDKPDSPSPHIDTPLVVRLIASQFPDWAHLRVRPVVPGGWDNHTFRLGDGLGVRLPSARHYVAQVEKEHGWLPRLASRLPLPIPTPLARGRPSEDYPWPWSVYQWITGETAAAVTVHDLPALARDLGRFLAALQRIDPHDGPPPGAHNFHRGGSLTVYDKQTREAIDALHGRIDTGAAGAVWDAALGATWHGDPVWVHGDVAVGNLLAADGRLCAVIDFGCCAVGDPACDLTIAWTLFSGESRQAFRGMLPLDPATWSRARGWALWKALITLARYVDTDAARAAEARRVIDEVLTDAGHA